MQENQNLGVFNKDCLKFFIFGFCGLSLAMFLEPQPYNFDAIAHIGLQYG